MTRNKRWPAPVRRTTRAGMPRKPPSRWPTCCGAFRARRFLTTWVAWTRRLSYSDARFGARGGGGARREWEGPRSGLLRLAGGRERDHGIARRRDDKPLRRGGRAEMLGGAQAHRVLDRTR